MQETAHGLPAGDRHQPCAPGSEVAGEPAARPGPRHPGDHHAVQTAFHSRDRAGKPDAEATEVPVPPASPAPPLSHPGAFRPQREQRNAPLPHLTRATRTGASRSGESSNDTSSTIMSLTFSNRLNTPFNQGAFPGCVPGRKTNPQEAPPTPSHSTAQRRATTHENNTRALFGLKRHTPNCGHQLAKTHVSAGTSGTTRSRWTRTTDRASAPGSRSTGSSRSPRPSFCPVQY